MDEKPTITESTTFRDSIPTVDQVGQRVWIYPQQPPKKNRKAKGVINYYQLRSWLSYVLLLLLFTGPFIRINGNPLLMFNVVERKASIFGFMFWPQDFHLFAIAMVTGMFMIVVFTAVFGRIWCGWLCPQTVLMEMVFRKIEYFIEGDAVEQQKLNSAPLSFSKIWKKGLKLSIFFSLSFIISNLLLAYIIGSEELIRIVTAPPQEHIKGFVAIILFTLMFFGIFARFREQACTFVCPYGRVQSMLLDEQSIVVAYNWIRGGKRAKLNPDQSYTQRKEAGLGDCINCNLCVNVCPTGIDIRNGTQMECINCAACIDACNSVMGKIGFPTGLIGYDSEVGIEQNQSLRFTPRLIIYSIILCTLVVSLTMLFIQRDPIEANLFRTPGTLYQEMPDNRISNIYNLRLVNKSGDDMSLNLELINPPQGELNLAGGLINVKPGEHGSSAVIISYPRKLCGEGSLQLHIEVLNEQEKVGSIKTKFIGPAQKELHENKK